MAGKPNPIKEKRLSDIMEMIVDGYTRNEIMRFMRYDSGWDFSKNQAERYLKEVLKRLRDTETVRQEQAKAGVIDRLSKLYRKGMEQPLTYKVALDAQKELDKIFGIVDNHADQRDGLYISLGYVDELQSKAKE